MIGNSMVGHALTKGDGNSGGTAYLNEEDLITHEEEHMMSEEVTSEDDEKVEQQMITVALVSSVVDASKQQSPDEDESKQRYSLRKRRRPVGEKPADSSASEDQVAATTPAAKPPEATSPSSRTTTATIKVEPAKTQEPAKASPRTRAKIKAEAVPACTVAVAAAPLPVPLSASTPSSLPPALQPPLSASLPPRAPASTSRAARGKAAKDKAKRLVPAARIQLGSTPLTPNPTAIGVPNPLSHPLPASQTAPVAQHQTGQTFKTGVRLTVPCPLPASSFQEGQAAAEQDPAPEKKKVTIDLPPPQPRGRIFSIDLDPASLDFSVLDSGDSGNPAPASADLPLVSGDGRDRAFSFECFAFGINADEPLPPMSGPEGAHDQDLVALPSTRMRGDSIIFDPSSFQEGGIHEERALTTRESRGMSVDLEAAGLLPPSSDSVTDTHHYEHPPQPVSSYSAPAPAPVSAHVPDAAHSNMHPPVTHSHVSTHPHSHPPVYQQHPGAPSNGVPHPVLSSSLPHDMQSGAPGSVSIISSCASSTTLQMELLNKDGRIGIYLPEARKERIARFHAKRKMRIWRKRIKYDCRKKLADSRPRIKGRFVKRTDTD